MYAKVINNQVEEIIGNGDVNVDGLHLLKPCIEQIPSGYNPEINTLSDISYIINDDNVVGTYELINKPLADVKSVKINIIKNIARDELIETDWKVMRHLNQLAMSMSFPSLTDEEYQQLLTERQTIRDKKEDQQCEPTLPVIRYT